MDLIDGASFQFLQKRILESNLDEKEKKVSVKNQQNTFPNGIAAIGSDAMRHALLVQEFKGLKLFLK
jgi:hypothetical protein